jgi:hypothetical protein
VSWGSTPYAWGLSRPTSIEHVLAGIVRTPLTISVRWQGHNGAGPCHKARRACSARTTQTVQGGLVKRGARCLRDFPRCVAPARSAVCRL